MPSSISAKAPKSVTLVTTPSMSWPSSHRSSICDQGSGSRRFMLRPMRFRSSPGAGRKRRPRLAIVDDLPGCRTRFQHSSERCTRPSAPPRSTKAPKEHRLLTRHGAPLPRGAPRAGAHGVRLRYWRRAACRRQDEPPLAAVELDDLDVRVSPTMVGQPLQPLLLRQAHGKPGTCEAGIKPRISSSGTTSPPCCSLPPPLPSYHRFPAVPGRSARLSLAGHVKGYQEVAVLVLGTQNIDRHRVLADRQLGNSRGVHALDVGIGHNAVPLGAYIDDDLLFVDGQDHTIGRTSPRRGRW
jgi:hypothetical protein